MTASVTFVTDAGAQDYKDLRTNTWSIYGQGGISLATGLDMASKNPPVATDIAPAVGGGISYNLRPWIRFGANYEFSKYKREQRFSEFQVLPASLNPGDGITELVTNEGGVAYRRMWTMYHNADLTVEFNLMDFIEQNRESGRFSLHVGTGIGMMMAYGNTYTISMGYERWEDPKNVQGGVELSNNWASRAWVNANNMHHDFTSPYIPALLSLEYDIIPQVTLGLKGSYNFLLSPDDDMAPEAVGAAALTVRYNLGR